MSFFVTSRLFVQSLIKSEVIFKNLVKSHFYPSRVVDKYINEIREIQFHENDRSVTEYLEFPFKTFCILNRDSLKDIISKSYDIMKEKGLGKNPTIYSFVLQAFLQYDIDIDVQNVLRDIVTNQVPLNEEICNKFLQYMCNRAEMRTVEVLLDQMKSQSIFISETSLYDIFTGYIMAGEPEKAEFFINQRNLDAQCHFMFYCRCFAYASNGDIASLKNVLAEMKRKNVKFISFRYFKLYERLVYGNVDTEILNEIIDLTKDEILFSRGNLFALVASLNRADYFNYSVFIMRKLINMTGDVSKFFELFSTSRCPSTIFEQFFSIVEPRCRNVAYEINIFGDICFDTALDISQKFSQCKNWKLIFYSLINKAVCEKSLPHIADALDFTFQKLKEEKINILLSQSLLPSMLTSGIVSNYDEILNLFPTYRKQILHITLLKYLCHGNFDQYNNLRLKEKYVKNIYLKSEWSYIASELRNNLSLNDIERWTIEAQKYFQSRFIDIILENVVLYEVIALLKDNSMKEFVQLMDYAKKWNVKISANNLTYLLQILPQHAELFHDYLVNHGNAENHF